MKKNGRGKKNKSKINKIRKILESRRKRKEEGRKEGRRNSAINKIKERNMMEGMRIDLCTK